MSGRARAGEIGTEIESESFHQQAPVLSAAILTKSEIGLPKKCLHDAGGHDGSHHASSCFSPVNQPMSCPSPGHLQSATAGRLRNPGSLGWHRVREPVGTPPATWAGTPWAEGAPKVHLGHGAHGQLCFLRFLPADVCFFVKNKLGTDLIKWAGLHLSVGHCIVFRLVFRFHA